MSAPRSHERPDERRSACFDLPPAPRFCRTAQLTDCGIALGEGVILAPLTKRANGAVALAVAGREAGIYTLLSLAQGGAVPPNVLHGLHGISKSLAQGDLIGAAIRLAQIGLPPLRGPRDAEMLKAGAIFLGKGFSPSTILLAAGIEGPKVQLVKAEWDESLHPRDPSSGRFVSAGGVAAVPASVAARLIAGGAMRIAIGVYALAGGALLSLTAAGWVLSHGPKGDIQDGPGYWLPGVLDENWTSPRDNDAADDAMDRKQQCEDLYRIDTDTCRAIARRRGASAGAACYTSASERYAACLSGKPIPPLNTWNN